MLLKIKKQALLISTVAILTIPTISYAQSITLEVEPSPQSISELSKNIGAPYRDIIKWRYKDVDGKLYRRQYNYPKQEWIGEWERC